MADFPACTPCPETYCGRAASNVSFGRCEDPCGSCPWGWSVNLSTSFCSPCYEQAGLKDYMYIFFVVAITIVVQWIILTVENAKNYTRTKLSPWVSLTLGGAVVAESAVAIIGVILLYPPIGSFTMYVCPVTTPTDFYPMFWSSSGSKARHCVYEAAYPRSTLPLVYFGATIFFLLTVRLVLTAVCWRKHPHNNSLCVGLIALPCLAGLHVGLSGLLYYSFEYISMAAGGIGLAVEGMFLQWWFNTMNPFTIYKSPLHWMMLLISIMFTAFGVLGLTFYDVLSQRLALLPLTLAPAVLYPLFTLCVFTHPYPRLWHMRRRTREEAEWPRGTAHRWSRGSRVFRTEFTTSLTTSSDTAMLY